MKKKCLSLAGRIHDYFAKGIRPGPDVLHYINSTFSNPDCRELQLILSDTENCESESLKSFFLKMNCRRKDFFEYFRFVLDFLEESPRGISLRKSLAATKKQHLKNIRTADQFEILRKGRNVETMILQGVRIPHFDLAAEMKKVVMIDDVGLAIYAQTM